MWKLIAKPLDFGVAIHFKWEKQLNAIELHGLESHLDLTVKYCKWWLKRGNLPTVTVSFLLVFRIFERNVGWELIDGPTTGRFWGLSVELAVGGHPFEYDTWRPHGRLQVIVSNPFSRPKITHWKSWFRTGFVYFGGPPYSTLILGDGITIWLFHIAMENHHFSVR